jgi:hypothetical protein
MQGQCSSLDALLELIDKPIDRNELFSRQGLKPIGRHIEILGMIDHMPFQCLEIDWSHLKHQGHGLDKFVRFSSKFPRCACFTSNIGVSAAIDDHPSVEFLDPAFVPDNHATQGIPFHDRILDPCIQQDFSSAFQNHSLGDELQGFVIERGDRRYVTGRVNDMPGRSMHRHETIDHLLWQTFYHLFFG